MTADTILLSAQFRKTVLICDNEPDVLTAFRFALRSSFEIHTTSSGQECLDLYSELTRAGKHVDILLLDYRLGDMSGDELACRIRDINGTKVVLISAVEMESSLIQDLMKRNCIVSFLKKPVSMVSLIATLEAL